MLYILGWIANHSAKFQSTLHHVRVWSWHTRLESAIPCHFRNISSTGVMYLLCKHQTLICQFHPDGQTEEFDEDHTFPVIYLINHYIHHINDINHVSHALGIPLEALKDISFSNSPTFIGLTWNLVD